MFFYRSGIAARSSRSGSISTRATISATRYVAGIRRPQVEAAPSKYRAAPQPVNNAIPALRHRLQKFGNRAQKRIAVLHRERAGGGKHNVQFGIDDRFPNSTNLRGARLGVSFTKGHEAAVSRASLS